MIIRSQDKKTLVNFDRCNALAIIPRQEYEQTEGFKIVPVFHESHTSTVILGGYSTEERALAVLDEIQGLYAKYRSVKQTSPGGYSTPSFVYGFEYPKVYEMPPDEAEEST